MYSCHSSKKSAVSVLSDRAACWVKTDESPAEGGESGGAEGGADLSEVDQHTDKRRWRETDRQEEEPKETLEDMTRENKKVGVGDI